MRPQTIVERLDFVAKRIPGLKFTPPTQLKPGDDQFYGCFMSCETYYIEIKVDHSHQSVKDVIISHGNNPDGISCPVLKKVLADQDFETFAKHLSGLHSIYQINTNDKKVKQRAYPALTSLENDLSTLYDIQRRKIINNCHDLVHKSPIGVMEPRKGGLPVRLTYFITPYDLVDTTQRIVNKPTADSIMNKGLGLSATVEIEGSSPHKIQIKSLIMQNSSSLPAYAAFNSQNSEKLPAQFVLRLSQQFPMLITSINQIMNEIQEPATIKEFFNSLTLSSKESIVSLIARQELDLNKGPFCRTFDTLRGADIESCDLKKHVYSVKLPDQAHTYHVLDNYLERPEGVYVTKLPFTHPTSIPIILKILRQQALFNFVVGSCIRRSRQSNSSNLNMTESNGTSKSDLISNIFDVIPVSLNNICISFEHPSRESLATLEIDFEELTCQLYALDKESVCSNEFATKVLQKCWSIPITLRSVLKKCNEKRLALLEDSNKRRERELQELLTNNATSQSSMQLKPNPKQQDTLLQSRFSNSNEKTSSRDLNSIAEFLSNKAQAASTSDNNNDPASSLTDSSSRTNLLKKFSCKPKVRQSTATKSQAGNKILSLMLKRQNSTSSADEPNLKAPSIKKVKTKHLAGDPNTSENTTGLTTTKLIIPEAANAARFNNKLNKQPAVGVNLNAPLSLIRSPSKSQPPSSVGSSMNNQTTTGTILLANPISTSQKQPETTGPKINDIVNNIKMKAQANGANVALNSAAAGKPRKSSIGALIDRLVCNVTPEQQQQMQQQQQNNAIGQSNSVDQCDGKSANSNGNKTKSSRLPGGDQFAIKQGSSGGGLKLTVTKTKPSTPQGSTTSKAGSTNSAAIVSPSTTTISSASSNAPTSVANTSSIKSEAANKIIDLGSSTPSIRYTIPKISKSQQASQSSNASNESSNSNDSQGDDSNPSSSGNTTSAAPSSTTAAKQRTTSNPFKQTANPNRSSVSSSTHPPNRTTSNPLANPNRPSSTSNIANNDGTLQARISSSSSSNNGGGLASLLNQQVASLARQQQQQQQQLQAAVNRPLNMLQAQSQLTQSPIVPALQQLPNIQHMLNPAILGQPQVQQAQQLISQQVSPLFQLRLPTNQQNAFPNHDLNLIMASQAALLNQQKQMQIQQQQQQLLQQTQQQLQQSQALSLARPASSQASAQQLMQQARVSSSTELGADMDQSAGTTGTAAQSSTLTTTTSTPSSPTECGQVETVAPPPLIPIDSLDEANIASPDEEDVHDDESDRLSIVDMNEAAPECNSTAGTPKPTKVDLPNERVQESLTTTEASAPSSSSSSSSAAAAATAIAATTASAAAIHDATSSSSPAVEPVAIAAAAAAAAASTTTTTAATVSAATAPTSAPAPATAAAQTTAAAAAATTSD